MFGRDQTQSSRAASSARRATNTDDVVAAVHLLIVGGAGEGPVPTCQSGVGTQRLQGVGRFWLGIGGKEAHAVVTIPGWGRRPTSN